MSIMSGWSRAFVCGLMLQGACVGHAQTTPPGDPIPGRTVHLIVAFPPGGGQDLVARVLAPKLGAALDKMVIVENSSGGAGFVGIMAAVRSKPDGTTLLINTMGLAVNAAMYRQLPFDPTRDLTPVALVGTTPFYIGVTPELGFKSLHEFLEAARSNPGKYKGASFANSTGAATIELLRQRAGVDVRTISYRGVAPAASATIAGETDFLMVDGASILPFIDSGRLQGLAVAARTRVAERPSLPTMIEAGVPNFVIDSWFGIFVRGGTPAAVVARWNEEINKALGLPDVQQRLTSIGMMPAQESQEAFAKRYQDEIERWKDVVEKGKIPLLD
jgi:tripartite-type tricarboxylate transporter receptor subunit TctC